MMDPAEQWYQTVMAAADAYPDSGLGRQVRFIQETGEAMAEYSRRLREGTEHAMFSHDRLSNCQWHHD